MIRMRRFALFLACSVLVLGYGCVPASAVVIGLQPQVSAEQAPSEIATLLNVLADLQIVPAEASVDDAYKQLSIAAGKGGHVELLDRSAPTEPGKTWHLQARYDAPTKTISLVLIQVGAHRLTEEAKARSLLLVASLTTRYPAARILETSP